MTPEMIFKLSAFLAAAGWFILFFLSQYWFRADRFIVGIVILLLAITYTWLAIDQFEFGLLKEMTTLQGFADLFSDKHLAVTGWVHYLAIDLLAGVWIKKNSFKHGISHWLTILCLFLTMAAAPIGLLTYLIIRAIHTKQYFSENF